MIRSALIGTPRRLAEQNGFALRITLVLVTGVAWGSSVAVHRLGILEAPPLVFVSLRLGVATLAFAIALVAIQGRLPSDGRTRRDIALIGVTATGVPLVAGTFALLFMSAGMLAIFLSLAPLLTAIMAHLWLSDERLSLRRAAGLTAALGGVVFLLGTGTTGLGTAPDWRGPALASAGALFAAGSAVYTRRRLRGVDALAVAAGQTAVGLVVVVPIALAVGGVDLSEFTLRGWFAVLYTGLVGSFLGFLVYFTIIRRFGATTGLLPTYLMPLASGLIGMAILGEVVTLPLVAGGGLVLSGVYLGSR
ncbi:MAG: DMT family transporter [Anaerolineae bacterium]